MKKIFLLTFLGILGICTRVAAQDAATLFKRANDQYALFKNEQSRGGSSAVMYTHLYECYELYVKVLDAPNNKAQLTGTKSRLRSIYNDLMNGAAYFLNNKKAVDFLNLATAYIELPKKQALRSEHFERSEQYAGLLYNTARGCLEMKKYPEAIKYLKEFMGTNPADEMLRDSYIFLNMAYNAQKNYVQQELILEEASKKFPLAIEFLQYLYNLHITTGNNQKLAGVVDRILEMDPNNTQVLTLKAKLLVNQDKIQDAFPIYERLYKLVPDNPRVLKDFARANFNVGVVIMNNGNAQTEQATRARELQRAMDYFEEAQVLFLKYLEKEPADRSMMQALAYAYLYGGKEIEGKVLKAMVDEGVSYDNYHSRLVAYKEVHSQEGLSAGQGAVVANKPIAAPELVIGGVRLLDGNGNEIKVIEAGERFKIEFSVRNNGKGEAYNLRLSLLEEQAREVYFDGAREKDGGHIKPGSSQTYLFDFIASGDMPSFLANIEIRANEQNGFDADKYTLKVNTSALAIPRLHIAEHLFESEEGSAITKNSNGVLTLAVQNRGAKEARNVKLAFAWPANVFGETEKRIDNIQPGKYETIKIPFTVNNRFDGDSIAVVLAANDESRTTFLDETFRVKLGEYLNAGGMSDFTSGIDTRINIEEVTLRENNELLDKIPVGGKNPHRYALIIGNENYSILGGNAEINVPYAVRDAYVFKEYCIRTFGIPDQQIEFVPNATAGLMQEKLDWLINIASANPKAEIFFYYSGHGNNDEATKAAYLLPVDITGKNVRLGMALDELYQRLGALSVKGAYVFLDACFSGGSKSAAPLISQKGVRVSPKVNSPHGRTVGFSSSSGEQTSSVYHEKKQGYYTYFLLKVLQDADGNLTMREWFRKTNEEVRKATALLGKMQEPHAMPSPDWSDWGSVQLKTMP